MDIHLLIFHYEYATANTKWTTISIKQYSYDNNILIWPQHSGPLNPKKKKRNTENINKIFLIV